MVEELAAVTGTAGTIEGAFETAALRSNGTDPHQEMFVKVTADGLETPASGAGANQLSYCTLHPKLFDELAVSESINALFPVGTLLDWLGRFDPSSTLTLSMIGESGAEMATRLQLSTDFHEVTIDCVDDPEILTEVETWLPERFDGNVFLDESGEPLPTTIETTTDELKRIVAAVERIEDVEQYPLATVDSELCFELAGDLTQITGQLAATVNGPEFDEVYGAGFDRVVRAIHGQVMLYTGPDEPLAFVCDEPGLTLRYVVRPL